MVKVYKTTMEARKAADDEDRQNLKEIRAVQDKTKKSNVKLTPASDKDVDIIKGDKSESGSNSYASSNQAIIKSLKGVKLAPVSDKDIETLKKTNKD